MLKHYLAGQHHEVYRDILMMNEKIYEEPVYNEVLALVHEMMRHIRWNIEQLVPRLYAVHYQFGKGFWEQFNDLASDEQKHLHDRLPVFKPPSRTANEQLAYLEQLVGSVPLSLKYWYKEVGSINLVGLFSSVDQKEGMSRDDGCLLDPLFIYPIDVVIEMVHQQKESGAWLLFPSLALSPDCYYKYGLSGTGSYSIPLPCLCFDTQITLESSSTTFIDYLRSCFQWGGFPGLAYKKQLSDEMLHFLTKDLMPF